jgi:hypothetical protein
VLLLGVLPYRREAGQFKVMDESMAKLAKMEWLTDDALAGPSGAILRRVENQSYFAAHAPTRWARTCGGAGLAAGVRAGRSRRGGDARTTWYASTAATCSTPRPSRVYVQPEKVPILLKAVRLDLPLFIG